MSLWRPERIKADAVWRPTTKLLHAELTSKLGTSLHISFEIVHAFAGMSKNIVVSSVGNILEIWDKENYEKAIDDAVVDFADLAEEVMGQDEDGIS